MSISITFKHQILTLLKRVFSGKVKFEASRKTKMTLGGSGGMLPRKIFKNLHTVDNGYVSAFRTNCYANFVPLPLISLSPKMLIAFRSHIFDLRMAKGLFALTAILIRFVFLQNFIRFLT